MIRSIAFFAMACLALPGIVLAQATPAEKIDLTGKWSFTVTTDAGAGSPTVTLVQKGDSLTGHYSSQALGEADLTGTVSGREFSFSATVSVQGTSFAITYKGTIENKDSLKGSVTLGELGSGTFTAKRAGG